jgi:hypothetical protein
MRRTLARAMTEARSAPVFVSRTPARFGQSVWDAVGMTSCRGLFYDEQARVEFATSVDELCKWFQVWKRSRVKIRDLPLSCKM